MLAVFGEEDPFVPPEQVRALEGALAEAGVRAAVRVQPGAGHAFMNDTRPDCHDPVAARAGWDAALAFLRAELL